LKEGFSFTTGLFWNGGKSLTSLNK
jgi:hypothetical protein